MAQYYKSEVEIYKNIFIPAVYELDERALIHPVPMNFTKAKSLVLQAFDRMIRANEQNLRSVKIQKKKKEIRYYSDVILFLTDERNKVIKLRSTDTHYIR